MHFTSAISVIAAYTLFATANGAVIHDNLSGVQCDVGCIGLHEISPVSNLTVALARLEAAHAEVTEAVHARNVNAPAAEPAAIAYVLCLSI